MNVSKSGISFAVVAAVLINNSFAADTLVDAFKEGKVSGAVKSFYRDASISGQDSNGVAMGGELGYITGSLNGFGAGITFQTSHTMGLKENNVAEIDNSVAISKTMLSEAYLSYSFDKTLVKVGRQYIDTPLVSSSSSRMLNGMFQAITVANTSLPETTLIVGAVNKWQYRAEEIQDLEEEIYTLYMLNKSIKGLELTAQGTVHKNDRNLLFADASYNVPISFPLTVGVQYLGDYADVVGEKDSYMYGLMVGTNIGGVGLSAYYNATSKEGDVNYGYGQGTDWTYNSLQWLTGVSAGTDSYQGKISYDFGHVGIQGLSAFARYAIYDNSVNVANDAKEWNFDVKYKFSGAVKGLETRIRYADIAYDQAGKANEHDFRFIANYKF